MKFDHMTRREAITGMALVGAGLLLPLKGLANEAQPGVAPEEALKRLKEGNARFVVGKTQHPRQDMARIKETAGGQRPFAAILSCADSRVPPETIFDQGIGDLFVIRVAGAVADTDEIGTVGYGAGHLGAQLVVVLGHTSCGAVTAVVKGSEVGGSIPKLVDNIAPAAERAKAKGLQGDELVLAAIRENVQQSIDDLQKHSQELAHLVKEGKLKIVGALYRLDTGAVEWL